MLGLIFLVFGVNFFLHFIPVPPGTPESQEFLGALFKTGYMFPIIKVLEIGCGIALLASFFVPLALLILAPIIVNIALVHLILDTSGAPIALALLVLAGLTAWSHWSSFVPLFKAKA